MSRESLRLGLEAGGGVLPGPSDLGGPHTTGSGRGSLLQTPVCDLRTPGTPKGGLEPTPISTASNGGVPTLTTPTLTPTTLRNIEQMFAESNPHEPPPQYEHAAGFAPPIISPTSGNSYVPLGQVSPLNCHRPPSPSGPPDLCPIPTKPSRPTNLSLSRPPPLLEVPPRNRPTCLQPPQQQADDLSLPSPTRGDLSISIVKPVVIITERQQVTTEIPQVSLERNPQVPLTSSMVGGGSVTNRPANNQAANLLSHKLDMMDKLLKAVAASNPVMTVPKQEVKVSYSPPPYEEEGRNMVGRRSTEDDSIPEDGRRALRRERNKQAAARCRKRRMDLTCTLQGEVDQWEDKVRGLKEELLQLEAQKKGLEAVLKRHQGVCKVHKLQN